MKPLALAILLSLGCASVAPAGPPSLLLTVSNHYRDPVDVTIYCGSAQLDRIRWLMREQAEVVGLRVRHGCDLRVTIEPSITGSRYATPEGFDSRNDLYHAAECSRLVVRAAPILPATYVMPGGC